MLEVVHNGDHTAQLRAIELVRPGRRVRKLLDGFSVAQMLGTNPHAFAEATHTRTEAGLLESIHAIGEVARCVECRCRHVNVDHELLEARANGRIEAFPGLETTAERYRCHRRWEEVTIAPDHDTTAFLSSGWVCAENEVQSGDDWHDVVLAELGVAVEMAGQMLAMT